MALRKYKDVFFEALTHVTTINNKEDNTMPSPTKHGTGSIPVDGVEFELTLETAPDPMKMVRDDGYNLQRWEYKGKGVAIGTRHFKLVRVGYCNNLDEVKQKLGGDVPEGQWREAFKKAFPKNDGNGPIGFTDDSWVSPSGRTSFPVLSESGKAWFSDFRWAGFEYLGLWRWLAPCK